jgi:hypothetical protein
VELTAFSACINRKPLPKSKRDAIVITCPCSWIGIRNFTGHYWTATRYIIRLPKSNANGFPLLDVSMCHKVPGANWLPVPFSVILP